MPATLGMRKLSLHDRKMIAQTGDLPEGYQLFQDSMPLTIVESKKTLSESINGKKMNVMRLTGVFQRADEKNANGRVYPKSILKDAVESMQEGVSKRQVMGEFDHPADAKIHMDRVSHLITKLWMDGKVVYGELEVINDDRSPYGSMLACYIDRGIQVGISSRGVGDMEMDIHEGTECYMVQEGFQFVTFDAVAEPSVKGTQLKKLNESIARGPSPKQLKQMREKLVVKEIEKFLLG
jgi:hypothetical protein